MTDQEIIEAYWCRDEAAIRGSEAQYGRLCFGVANNILGDIRDAEECVSDTWLGAWKSIPPQRPQRLGVFLARITRNLALNRYKARQAQKRGGGELSLILEELGECVSGPDGVESEVLARELGALLGEFIRALPERERGLFLRRYFYSQPVAEAARRCGVSSHHATVILSRTRQKLRAYLEKEDFVL